MTLDHIDIVLPWPDTMLFPNRRRGSFRKFQPYIEAARRSGFHCARLALGRNTIRLGARNHVRLLFGMPDRRNRDLDGCVGAIKHYLDGIAQALGVDDRVFRPVLLDDCLDREKTGFVLVQIRAGDSKEAA